ncbi:MAG: Flp pilus assembly complex ATPase component TadA [Propionibacteriaceae bacterium]|nr:Flp pilus assembly complex ATPase component TadA [Propionibacteriaceae bacterium]
MENIMVYGFDDVHVERADFGHQRMDPIAESDEELTQMIQDMASHAGGSAPFSPANPNLEMMLPDGSRLAATLSTGRPSLNIRRHRIKEVTVDELIGLGSVTQVMADFLKAAVRANLSICISGPMNSGKTTFLRALCTQFTSEDVVGTFESDREIMLHQEPLRSRFAKVYPWEERSGGGEIGKDGRRAGRREMSELIIESKRFNLTRAVIGEVRGKEVWQVIKTMEEIGCLFTTHAISAGACMEKLISCAQEDPNVNGVELVTRKLGQTLHLVIQLEHERQWIDKGHDQWRWDRHVKEIVAAERGERSGSGIALTTVFRHVPSEPAVAFQVPDRLVERLRDAGWTQTQEQQFLLQIQANLDRWAQ